MGVGVVVSVSVGSLSACSLSSIWDGDSAGSALLHAAVILRTAAAKPVNAMRFSEVVMQKTLRTLGEATMRQL